MKKITIEVYRVGATITEITLKDIINRWVTSSTDIDNYELIEL